MRCATIAAVAVGTLLITGRASAEDPYPPDCAPIALSPRQKLRWETLVAEGRKLVEAGRWKEAIAKLQEVIEMKPHPEAFLLQGYAEQKLGDLLEAKVIYHRAAEEAQCAKLPDWLERAAGALADLDALIPRLVIRLPPGVAEATVSVDSVSVAIRPRGLEVDPGAHTVQVSATDRQDFHAEVTVKEGALVVVEAVLPLKPPPPPSPPPPSPPPPNAAIPGGAIAVIISGGAVTLAGLAVLGYGAGASGSQQGATVGGGITALAGVGICAGGALWAASPKSNAPASLTARVVQRVRVGAAPLPGGGWASFSGRF
jgi:hypothetical protein